MSRPVQPQDTAVTWRPLPAALGCWRQWRHDTWKHTATKSTTAFLRMYTLGQFKPMPTGLAYATDAVFPVHVKAVKGVAPVVPGQLLNHIILHPPEELRQAVVLELLCCCSVLRLCLCPAVSGPHRLLSSVSSEQGFGLTPSLRTRGRQNCFEHTDAEQTSGLQPF